MSFSKTMKEAAAGKRDLPHIYRGDVRGFAEYFYLPSRACWETEVMPDIDKKARKWCSEMDERVKNENL